MKKRITSLVLVSALGLGGAAAGLVIAPALASAATSETSTSDALSDRVTKIKEALAGLVGDGSITQEQADEVATTLAEQMPERGHHRHGGPGGPGGGHNLETAATVLGITVEELRAALASGQSLADVAADRGVEKETLIGELVESAQARLDERVAAGDLTQAEADERKAELTERITDQVEREGLPVRGDRHAPSPDQTDEPSTPESGSST